MKLSKYSSDKSTGLVTCEVRLTVQNMANTFTFAVSDSDLLQLAASKGRETWDEVEICELGEPIVGVEISI